MASKPRPVKADQYPEKWRWTTPNGVRGKIISIRPHSVVVKLENGRMCTYPRSDAPTNKGTK